MAIAFARVSIHSRSKGHSAVAASAYRTASKLFDHRTGITHDFSNRGNVAFSEIMLPRGASECFFTRELLWNEVEQAETRKNSQLCKDVVLALPKELTLTDHIELTRRFANKHFVEQGLACDIAIHDDNDGNPHAHILVTLRRLEGNQFAKHKARDLNPQFAKGVIVEGDFWNKEWREFQTDYFQEKNLDLTVDLDHLISEKHEGRLRDEAHSYLKEENKLIREVREELALDNLDNLINRLSLSHSVFTRRDVEKLLFKTVRSEVNSQTYLSRVEQLLAHKDVISLGPSDRGLDSYTTQHQYLAEAKLLDDVESLQCRRTHHFSTEAQPFIQRYQLNEEQAQAFSFITEGPDLSVLIGRPGVGKSYLLKPLKEYYEENQNRVIGAALSGKVAKALHAETGIESSTITSLTYRLNNQLLTLSKKDILIVDEAGMVDFTNMACLLKHANQAYAKVILVGDPDQLKPIHKGEIFRGIAERSGYIELANIMRQRQESDRKASLALAKGDTEAALNHYAKQGSIHLKETVEQAQEAIIKNWSSNLEDQPKDHILLAFTRKAVSSLNTKAREVLKEQQYLSNQDYEYQSQGGKETIKLTAGERVLFRQSEMKLGIRNGDLATITQINADNFNAKLDSGEQVIIPKTYSHIDYGYALTVHKAQGMTVDKASVLVDSLYWDRNLSFVAMTRHREQLHLFADKETHPDLEALTKTLSRTNTKDNVIDWPLDYSIRNGFSADSMLNRALDKIQGLKETIKHKWNYIVNYEAYLKDQIIEKKFVEKQVLRTAAKEVAQYLDKKAVLRKELNSFDKQSQQLGKEKLNSPAFKELYQQSIERDKKAFELVAKYKEQFEKMTPLSKQIESIKNDKERYLRYLTINKIANLPHNQNPDEKLLCNTAKIDLKKDYIHIIQAASQTNQQPSTFYKRIETYQKIQQQKLLQAVMKDYPLLNEYNQLQVKRNRLTGFKAKQIERMLSIKAEEIIKNKPLYEHLQQQLPFYASYLNTKIKSYEQAKIFL